MTEGEAGPRPWRVRLLEAAATFRLTPRVVRLVLSADAPAAAGFVVLSVVGALLPLAVAYVGKLIVDGVVLATKTGLAEHRDQALQYVAIELGLMLLNGLLGRGSSLLRSLLQARLGFLIHLRILGKASTLELADFENPEIYDKLQNARREAGSRPMNLFVSSVEMVSNTVTLASYAIVLVSFSPLTLLILAAATVPSFIVEARFSGEAFRLFSWRAPEGRRMRYLEMLLTRDNTVKEVKLYRLGGLLLERYRRFYHKFFAEDRSLAVRRSVWGFFLGAVSTTALYGCYAWIVVRTLDGVLTLGDMTLYITVFRQGQGALRSILRSIGSTYEDNLFMSNLFTFLDLPRATPPAPPATVSEGPRTGFVLEGVSFKYPGARGWALEDLSLTIGPEEKLAIVGENGAGKTTLIKLLTGLYAPTSGRITLDGRPLHEIPPDELQGRVAAVLQDFVRYQFSAAENVGLGFAEALDDRARIERAAERGGAREVIEALPRGFDTQLGRWFKDGAELSAGNWQKVAVSRAFMRDADILILDEPTASLDAEAEHALFERFRELTEGRMALLISHRFSTVRMADRIAVLSKGRLQELGSHRELVDRDGRYAHLFRLQAAGYLDV